MSGPQQAFVWKPGEGFWLQHFWFPLLAASLVLLMLENSGVDLWLADQWFALQGQQWAWRNHWVSYDLIHHHGKQLVIAIGLLTLVLIIASFIRPDLRRWRAPMTYLLTTMALVPALIATFKKISPVPCPWDLSRYGGDQPYLHNFDYQFAATGLGHCFPSGHASGGFILLAMYFAALPFVKQPALLLLPGILIGWVFALGQQSRGAHFLSHDVWTMSICWFGALGLFLLFRPGRWVGGSTGAWTGSGAP